MIEIGLIIGGGVGFHRFAKENGLNPWVWAFVPLVSYFLGAFVAGIVLFIVAPSVLEDTLVLGAIGLLSGALFIGLAYLLMKKTAQNKLASVESESSDILDHNLDLE